MADENAQGVEEQGGAPAAVNPAPGSGEVERRLAEVENREQQLLQLAITQHLNSLPEDKRAAAQLEIADRLRREKEARLEEQAKRLVIRQAALDHGLSREELEEAGALDIVNPEAIERLAKTISKLKGDVKESKRRSVESREEPAIAGVRPDSGGQGGAPSRQEIVAKYRGSNDIAGLRQALRAAGY